MDRRQFVRNSLIGLGGAVVLGKFPSVANAQPISYYKDFNLDSHDGYSVGQHLVLLKEMKYSNPDTHQHEFTYAAGSIVTIKKIRHRIGKRDDNGNDYSVIAFRLEGECGKYPLVFTQRFDGTNTNKTQLKYNTLKVGQYVILPDEWIRSYNCTRLGVVNNICKNGNVDIHSVKTFNKGSWGIVECDASRLAKLSPLEPWLPGEEYNNG